MIVLALKHDIYHVLRCIYITNLHFNMIYIVCIIKDIYIFYYTKFFYFKKYLLRSNSPTRSFTDCLLNSVNSWSLIGLT